MIILDTDHMTVLERAGSLEYERLRRRLERVSQAERATTIVTYEEQMRGWLAYVAKARTVDKVIEAYRKLSRNLDLYRAMLVLEFEDNAGAEYERLQKARLRVGAQDLKIAAIVLAHDATLLTRNLVDFQKVPGLKIEDWTV